MQCSYNVTSKRVRVTIVAVEKHQVLNIMSVCLYSYLSYPACKSLLFCAVHYSHLLFPYFSSFISQAARFSKKEFLSVVRLAVPYFSTLSHKRRDFTKKNIKIRLLKILRGLTNRRCILFISRKYQ